MPTCFKKLKFFSQMFTDAGLYNSQLFCLHRFLFFLGDWGGREERTKIPAVWGGFGLGVGNGSGSWVLHEAIPRLYIYEAARCKTEFQYRYVLNHLLGRPPI